MRIKLDENLPTRLVPVLTAMGHDVDTVKDENMKGAWDPAVWEATQAAQRFLITQDLHFSDTRQYVPGSHCGILLMRIRDPGRDEMLLRIQHIFASRDVESWSRCHVVASEVKVRVTRGTGHSISFDL